MSKHICYSRRGTYTVGDGVARNYSGANIDYTDAPSLTFSRKQKSGSFDEEEYNIPNEVAIYMSSDDED